MSTYSEYADRPELQKKRARTLIARNMFIGLCALLVAVSLSLQTAGTIFSFGARNTIVDCVEPSGNCYKDGQARTGQAVTGIVVGTREVIIATQYCNNKLPNATVNALEACVDKQIKERNNGRQAHR